MSLLERRPETAPSAPGPGDRPAFAPTQEVRFAVVLYGGVSLAIYIHGVARELLDLVHATAPAAPTAEDPDAALHDAAALEGMGAAPVYRRLGQLLSADRATPDALPPVDAPITTRFVVDILSGSSAGGINGIALAMALANGTSMDEVRRTWVDEGDIGLLLNDKGSLAGLGDLTLDSPSPSLLNSRRMYRKLLDALNGLSVDEPSTSSPFVDELDLAITATDVHGLPVEMRLQDGVVAEYRHATVFPFGYVTEAASGHEHRNDFIRSNVPLLAYAARCTSSFPVAFETMSLDTVYRHGPRDWTPPLVQDNEAWQRIYRDYHPFTDFDRRPFADGGILDNKPFSQATSALLRRRADVPVDRRLLYVEPSPASLEEKVLTPPDAFQIGKAATLELPRQEGIVQDVNRVLERNALIGRIHGLLAGIEPVVRSRPATPDLDEAWAGRDVRDDVAVHGVAYLPYHRLRVHETTNDLAALVARAAGVDARSPATAAVLAIVEAWRERSYAETVTRSRAGTPPPRRSENAFLRRYDLAYRRRRLAFLKTRLNELGSPGPAGQQLRASWGIEASEDRPEAWEELHRDLRTARRRIAAAYAAGRGIGRQLARLEGPGVAEAAAAAAARVAGDVDALIALPDHAERVAQAHLLLSRDGDLEVFDTLGDRLAAMIERATVAADAAWRATLPPDGGTPLEQALVHYHDAFLAYDLVAFPLTYGTGAGETIPVAIARISPRDATSLIRETDAVPERDGRPGRLAVRKLAGNSLHHFGAFLKREWREADMVWGRLDGAERLITTLLPGHPLTSALVEEAQDRIVRQELAPGGLLAHQAGPSVGQSPRTWFRDYHGTLPKEIPRLELVRLGWRSKAIVADLLATVPGATAAVLTGVGGLWALDRGRRAPAAVVGRIGRFGRRILGRFGGD